MYSNKNCFGSIWAIQNFLYFWSCRKDGGTERRIERKKNEEKEQTNNDGIGSNSTISNDRIEYNKHL